MYISKRVYYCRDDSPENLRVITAHVNRKWIFCILASLGYKEVRKKGLFISYNKVHFCESETLSFSGKVTILPVHRIELLFPRREG